MFCMCGIPSNNPPTPEKTNQLFFVFRPGTVWSGASQASAKSGSTESDLLVSLVWDSMKHISSRIGRGIHRIGTHFWWPRKVTYFPSSWTFSALQKANFCGHQAVWTCFARK